MCGFEADDGTGVRKRTHYYTARGLFDQSSKRSRGGGGTRCLPCEVALPSSTLHSRVSRQRGTCLHTLWQGGGAQMAPLAPPPLSPPATVPAHPAPFRTT